ncbi:MAG TPA: nitrogenase cofactor biosynthesis protein NifB [Armatimonadota bacterium]
MNPNLRRHPCFSAEAKGLYGRVHLPVAPKCNVQCSYCNRGYDCANESRPGVTSAVLSPGQALVYLERVLEREPRISVVGIAGPGDPFANAGEALETCRLVHQRYPDLHLCVSSNGLGLPPHLNALAEAGVSHVTLTINAVDPEVGGRVYAWVRDRGMTYRGAPAGSLMAERQRASLRGLKEQGLTVKVNCILIPGVNDEHVVEIARAVAAQGADLFNCIPLLPTPGTAFAETPEPSPAQLAWVRHAAAAYLPQMKHCQRCRADAVGLLSEPRTQELSACLREAAALPLRPDETRPYYAVASQEGMLVNQHLGRARHLSIFRAAGGSFELMERRPAPEPGSGPRRWVALAQTLHDCRSLLVSNAGQEPREALKSRGILVLETDGFILDALSQLSRGLPVRSAAERPAGGCGSGCRGDGMGCGG